jgi:hypothetical protein
MVVCVVALGLAGGLAGPAAARATTATAAQSYGAKVKAILDRYEHGPTQLSGSTPASVRRRVLAWSKVAGTTSSALDRLSAPRRWRADQQTTSQALRRLSQTLREMGNALKGKRSTADLRSVMVPRVRRLTGDVSSVERAITGLRKAT